ncbi:MAG TPA: transketolase C-terminal domain-containing protein [Anaerolineaceae bacterium]|nr:transketolase C-terminal domain-containing protein [Anaerolineaceae bacterium]HPN53422.1 transketolase C-terminal domain-containing protein [Anaerolineaceae bacterium]
MISMLDGLNQALHHAMQTDERVVLMGEDILDPYGGAFKVTRGLSSAFPTRVLASPIAEGGLVGVAAGMALRGLRPVVEIMFGDFLTLTADQLVNHAARFRQMYHGQVQVPMVVRTPMGGRRGYGPTHSQTLEKHFIGVAGLEVLAPACLPGPGGPPLLEHAILTAENPVLFIENKLQYLLKIPDEAALADFELISSPESAPCMRLSVRGAPSPTLTLAAYGYMAELARQALLKLAYEEEIFAELLIYTRLSPVEPAFLLESAAQTGRLLTIEEGSHTLGWGAEMISRAVEGLGGRPLAAARVAARDSAVPASPALEAAHLPGLEDICQAARRLVNTGELH